MEIFENDFSVIFTNKAAAKKAKQIAANAFNAMTFTDYKHDPSKKTADALFVDGKALTSDAIAYTTAAQL